MTLLLHGGRLDGTIRQFGGTPGDWLDLSTGVNLWPWPVPDLFPETWAGLPGAGARDCRPGAR